MPGIILLGLLSWNNWLALINIGIWHISSINKGWHSIGHAVPFNCSLKNLTMKNIFFLITSHTGRTEKERKNTTACLIPIKTTIYNLGNLIQSNEKNLSWCERVWYCSCNWKYEFFFSTYLKSMCSLLHYTRTIIDKFQTIRPL